MATTIPSAGSRQRETRRRDILRRLVARLDQEDQRLGAMPAADELVIRALGHLREARELLAEHLNPRGKSSDARLAQHLPIRERRH